MNRALFPRLAVLFLIVLLLGGDARAVEETVKLGGQTLSIKAPRVSRSGARQIYSDLARNNGVILSYGEVKARANNVSLDRSSGVIELSGGFHGKLGRYSLQGDYLRINSRTGNYAGTDLKLGYLGAYFFAQDYQFYGDQLAISKVAVSPTEFALFKLYAEKLEVHSGFSLAHQNTLKLLNLPVYYVPLYFQEARRSRYQLAFPAPRFKSDFFHGTYGLLHTHYFLNPVHYGDLGAGFSDQDGVGARVQHIVRASDRLQAQADLTLWQKGEVQGRLAGILQFFGHSGRRDPKLSFWEKRQLEEEIAAAETRLSMTGDLSYNEEIRRSIVDRTPELIVGGLLRGVLFEHQYTIAPSLSFGRFKEKKIFPETGTPQAVDRSYERTRGEVGFNYYLGTPQLKPFVNKALLDLSYEHSVYLPALPERGRLDTTLTVVRPIWANLGLYYKAALTKVLLDYGTSPFFFEEYGRLKDSALFDLYLQTPLIISGGEYTYDLSQGQLYNEVYYIGIRAGESYFTFSYDRRMRSWELGFTQKEEAF